MSDPAEHDAHVQLAHKLFRDVGFTIEAMQFPRSPEALDALRKLNNVPAGWVEPVGWRYHPNAWSRDNWKTHLATK